VKPLRLAVFTNQFPGYVSTFFARDMRALIEAGVEVDVFPLYPLDPALWAFVPDLLSEKVFPRERVHHLTLREALRTLDPRRLSGLPQFLRDVAAISFSAARYGPVVLGKTLYASLMAWAWSRTVEARYDHVLAYWGNYPGTSAYLFHRLTSRHLPFSLCIHAQIDLYETPAYLSQKLLYADNIVTICEYNRQFLQKHYTAIYDRIAGKLHINYRGLDLKEYPYRAAPRSPNRVLAVGRLSPEKGYDDLLRAMAELKRRGVDAELELVGEGPERAALGRLAQQLNIQGKVAFRGWLQPDGVRDAMLNATVLAQPSRIEGLPTVVEEAIALGIPVVGSRVGGIPELLDYGRAGMLMEPGDIRALADSLQAMLGDAELRLTLAERARAQAERLLDMWENGVRFAQLLRGGEHPAPLSDLAMPAWDKEWLRPAMQAAAGE
jgi:glycosyltransferase involved in cell wall biosynthesis